MAEEGNWFRCGPALEPVEQVKSLPKGALVSADGSWAELWGRKGPERGRRPRAVFVKLKAGQG